MTFQNAEYDVCRLYIRDQAACLHSGEYSKILGWIRSRNLPMLATCSDQFPSAYSEMERLKTFLQIEAFFKKSNSFEDLKVTISEGYSSFRNAEAQCELTNRRLLHFHENPERLPPFFSSLVGKMEDEIRWLLGDERKFIEELPKLFRVTPGATYSRSRKKSLPHMKVSLRNVKCTPRAKPYILALVNYFGYPRPTFKTGYANRVVLVPKNWKTRRAVACEQDWNVPLQLAVDAFLKRKLLQWGVDLSDQSLNQSLSRYGSLHGCFATLDLESASDTLSQAAVDLLLPEGWLKILRDLRAITFEDGGESETVYHKFSSMGNGYTFALESLVFAAACRAVGSVGYQVYGDDIIIEEEYRTDLTLLLGYLGFRVNTKKSHYYPSPFRESCGSSWWRGRNITPFYIRDWGDRMSTKCHNVNGLLGVCPPYGHLWNSLVEFLKEHKLPLVPYTENTRSGVHVDIHSAYSLKLFRYNRELQVQEYRSITPVIKDLDCSDTRGLFLWHLLRYQEAKPRAICFGNVSSDIDEYLERSGYYTVSRKDRMRWVRWTVPVVAAPQRCFYLGDQLSGSDSR